MVVDVRATALAKSPKESFGSWNCWMKMFVTKCDTRTTGEVNRRVPRRSSSYKTWEVWVNTIERSTARSC